MNRGIKVLFLLLPAMLGLAVIADGSVNVKELESQFGPLQGQMEMRGQTVLVFPGARVKVFHETGKSDIEPTDLSASSAHLTGKPALPNIRTLKRKIDRLPVHEQVRYWKLHKIRYPESDVTSELEAALDLMETIRKEAIVVQQQETREVDTVRSSSSRYRSSVLPFFRNYGYTSSYRYRRARHIDSQIELDRIQRKPRPVENWTTAMSVSDRARSEALGKVSGARSSALRKISGARSSILGSGR